MSTTTPQNCPYKFGRVRRKFTTKPKPEEGGQIKIFTEKMKEQQTKIIEKILPDNPQLFEHLINKGILEFFPILGYTTSICLPMITSQTINHCLEKMLRIVIGSIPKDVETKSAINDSTIAYIKKQGFKFFWLTLASILCRYVTVNDKFVDVAYDGIFMNDENDYTSVNDTNQFSVLKYHRHFQQETSSHFIKVFCLESMVRFNKVMLGHGRNKYGIQCDVSYDKKLDDELYSDANDFMKEDGIPYAAYDSPDIMIDRFMYIQIPENSDMEIQNYIRDQYESLSTTYPFVTEYIPNYDEILQMKNTFIIEPTDYIKSIHMMIFLKRYIWNRHWMDSIKRRLMFGFESNTTTEDLRDCDMYNLSQNSTKREVNLLRNTTGHEDVSDDPEIDLMHKISIDKKAKTFFTEYLERPQQDQLTHIIDAIVIRNNTMINGIPWFIPNSTNEQTQNLQRCSIIENVLFAAQRYLLPEVISEFFCRIETAIKAGKPLKSIATSLSYIQTLEEWYRSIATSTKANIYHDFPFDFRINGNDNTFYEDVSTFNEKYTKIAIQKLELFVNSSTDFGDNDDTVAILYSNMRLQDGSTLYREDIVKFIKQYIERLYFILDIMNYQYDNIKTLLLENDDRLVFSQPILYLEKNVNLSSNLSEVLMFTTEIAEHELEGRLKNNSKCEGTVHGCKLKLVILIASDHGIKNNANRLKPNDTMNDSDYVYNSDRETQRAKIVFSEIGSSSSIIDQEKTRLRNIRQNKIIQERFENSISNVKTNQLNKDDTQMGVGNTPKWDEDTRPITVIIENSQPPYFMNTQNIQEFDKDLILVSWKNFVTNIDHRYTTNQSSSTNTTFSNLVNRVGIAFINIAILCPFIALVFDEFRNSDMRNQNPNPEKYTSLYSLPKGSDLTHIPGRDVYKGPVFHYNQTLYTGSFNSHTPDDPLNYHMLMINYLKSKRLQRHCTTRLNRVLDLIKIESATENVDSQYVNYLTFDAEKQRKILDFLKNSCQCIKNTIDTITTMNPTDWIFADRSKYNFGEVTSLVIRPPDRKDEIMEIVDEFYKTVTTYQKIKTDVLSHTDQQSADITENQRLISGIVSKTTMQLETYFMDKINILRTYDKEGYIKSMTVAEKKVDFRKTGVLSSLNDLKKFRTRYTPSDDTVRVNELKNGEIYQMVISTMVAHSTKETRDVYIAQKDMVDKSKEPVNQNTGYLSSFFGSIASAFKKQTEPDTSLLSPEELKQFKTLTPDGKKIFISMRTNKRQRVDKQIDELNRSIIQEDKYFQPDSEYGDVTGKMVLQGEEFRPFGGPMQTTEFVGHNIQKAFIQNEMSEGIAMAVMSRLPGMVPNLIQDYGIQHMYSKLRPNLNTT